MAKSHKSDTVLDQENNTKQVLSARLDKILFGAFAGANTPLKEIPKSDGRARLRHSGKGAVKP